MSISINVYLMAVVFVSFIALLVLLNLQVYRPLLGYMDKREESITKDKRNIEQLHQEVAAHRQEAQNILNDARAQADKILQDALHNARANYESVVAQKEEELEKQAEQARIALKESKSNLKLELARDLPALEALLKLKISQI
ncbi:ATP synthase F0F1 subunit B' [Helicobacter ailurogastricus]|uniref:ATP synthase subunit b n=1 Tax=Helicobacter ailurogastricus TaxID=1578720 RepID=A0A0K2X6Q5_9HELI|nr:ATP synthase F0F1 subunit B' [Helicobacter ailurogastricus]GMB91216.1 F0F1 ATP synthase subunit B', AtpXF' [Helicobacter ailurogastricus]CRF41268.1 ATP synthase B' chain [Helicobacter ailurogastricus]CRF43323.1 ATP synthase B' chain [Helicobacter ailurogastricus]CRF44560.1 ATP synthase B' chain [Helicobacter ailurogastricus]